MTAAAAVDRPRAPRPSRRAGGRWRHDDERLGNQAHTGTNAADERVRAVAAATPAHWHANTTAATSGDNPSDPLDMCMRAVIHDGERSANQVHRMDDKQAAHEQILYVLRDA